MTTYSIHTEDENYMRRLLKVDRAFDVLFHISQEIRSKAKYGEFPEEIGYVWEEIQTLVHDAMDEYGIDLNLDY